MSTTPHRPPGLGKSAHVAAVLRERIQTGAYKPGTALPSEQHLIADFGYDRSTIRRGLALVRQEGLVTSEQGKGTFVRQIRTVRHELLQVLRAEWEHVQAGRLPNRGLFELTTGVRDDALTVQHVYSRVAATADVADAFGIEAGTELLERRYVFLVDGEPHQITRSFLPGDLVDGTRLTDPAIERPGVGTHLQLASIGVAVKSVLVDITARMPSPDEAAELAIAEGTPLLVDRRRSVAADDGRIVCVADTITPADRVRYGVDVHLGAG
jgi:DNA-binding GntR family transcriptional regulator